jgi:carbamate kinase
MMHMASAIRRDGGPPPPRRGGRQRCAVVAVGGNALTREDQLGTHGQIADNAAGMARSLSALLDSGWRVAVVHGNGPQVGNLAIQQDAAGATVPAQPMHQLTAMTQGQLGGTLAREIDRLRGPGSAVAVITHVLVDPDDPAFGHPTKPIGPFLDAAQAAGLARRRGWQVVEDSGRGHRRVVASPHPLEIVEITAIRAMLAAGTVVLAAGGGGVPVTRGADGALTGADAVVDKDHAAAVLGASIGADELYLLTGVDAVQLDFGTPRQRPVHALAPDEAATHLAAGQFPAGSMGPKVAAALRFVQDGGRRAIITSADRLSAAVAGEPGAGTRIEAVRAEMGVS